MVQFTHFTYALAPFSDLITLLGRYICSYDEVRPLAAVEMLIGYHQFTRRELKKRVVWVPVKDTCS